MKRGSALLGVEKRVETTEDEQRELRLKRENSNSCEKHVAEAQNPDDLGALPGVEISGSAILGPEWAVDTEDEQRLYEAARSGFDLSFRASLARVALKENRNSSAILERVTSSNTLLHVAAMFNQGRIAKYIAGNCPSLLTRTNSRGDTALHLAARAGHGKVAQILFHLKSDQVASSPSGDAGNTAREKYVNKELLRSVNDDGNTALHEALIHGHAKMAKDLVKADPEVSFYLNKEDKSPLYLAAEAGYKECIAQMLEQPEYTNTDKRLKAAKSAIRVAIINAATKRRAKDIFDVMLEKDPRLVYIEDEDGITTLHLAASIGHLKGVRFLLEKRGSDDFKRDDNGLFPIHVASIEGHVAIIKELVRHFPNAGEMLTSKGQNINHLAAKSGSYNVVSYILKAPELISLINQRDTDGNTPLHLAAMYWHPKIVRVLTRDERVNLQLVNAKRFTALDAAKYYMKQMPTYQQLLTWATLKAAGTPRASFPDRLNSIKAPTTLDGPSGESRHSMHMEPRDMDNYKDRVNTLLLVSTLIATITFAAGFTAPGGFNDSDPDKGMAILLKHKEFCLFILCDMIAMYSSIIVAVSLIWAQLGDLHLVQSTLKFALPLLGVALVMTSLAFMAGIYLVVSKLKWLGYVVLAIGSLFLVVLSLLFFPLSVSYPSQSSTSRIMRFIFYYSFELLVFLTES